MSKPGKCWFLPIDLEVLIISSIASVAQNTNSVTSALPSKQTSDATLGTRIEASRVDGSSQTKRNGSHRRDSYQNVASAQAGADDNGDDTTGSSDLWSAAYREAVESLKGDVDVVILNSNNVAQLFRKLDQLDKEANQESAFLRGVKYLQSVKVPLERFKLALDLASPLTNLEPTATTVFGVVRSITAIAISLAGADLEFAKQIGEMLEQISYIDDCDTLGQKADRADIHRVSV
ncbi:hypothetical protein GMORB2_5050 [Geosmithia morbida]|uniref:Uncharacterized protein n=1 Tax=Geosmithia morbida TaxID=1094350 RepID=A0A9P5D7C4_9HYPO|nr:uncharacterized protein GMORB2_5050 [Geosmithia morbida]KAF4124384.1 hypothetical protein GMORB2_5050 [Geosmithia morbida]